MSCHGRRTIACLPGSLSCIEVGVCHDLMQPYLLPSGKFLDRLLCRSTLAWLYVTRHHLPFCGRATHRYQEHESGSPSGFSTPFNLVAAFAFVTFSPLGHRPGYAKRSFVKPCECLQLHALPSVACETEATSLLPVTSSVPMRFRGTRIFRTENPATDQQRLPLATRC